MTHPSILVTGAASGIGESVVHRFANRNWHVGLLDRDAGALESVRDDLGHDAVSVHAADVTDPAAMQDAVADFGDAAGGRMDVLFNSAGVMTVGRFEELDLDVHRRHLDVNVFGVVVASRAAFPLLRDTPSARVISMASASGVYGTPELATYAASKAGVRSLTQALNLEWAHHGIHVCDVIPPYVDAPAGDPPAEEPAPTRPRRRLAPNLTAEDVADVVEEAVTEDRIHWPVGNQFRWVYRLSDVLPAPLVRLLMRYVSGF